MDSIRALLRSVHLFKELTDEELNPIVDIAQTKYYRERMMVFMQGDPLDRVFFIYSGKVKIFKTDLTGKEQIISILQNGDMFPHLGFFSQGTYPAHSEIMEDTLLIIIPLAEFENLLFIYPKLCVKLFRVMGEKIIELHSRLEEQVLHNTYEQILMLLLRLCKMYGTATEKGFCKLNTQFTNRELANMIGTSRETVSRTIAQLKKEKHVLTDTDGNMLINTRILKEKLSTQ